MYKRYYLQLEKKILQWAIRNRIRVTLYCLSLILVISASAIPYLNLYVTKQLTLFLIISLAAIIFRVHIERVSLVLVLIFILCIPLVLIKDYERAELLINLVYGLLFVSLFSSIGRFKKNDE